MSEPVYGVGVDVGGTMIRAGLVDQYGRVMHSQRVHTASMESVDELAYWIESARREWFVQTNSAPDKTSGQSRTSLQPSSTSRDLPVPSGDASASISDLVTSPMGVPTGIAVPGLPNAERTTVIRSVNVPWLEGVNLIDQLTRVVSDQVRLLTDAEAASWGEYSARSDAPTSFVHMRIGTGVGLGIVQNGKLIDLTQNRLGHLRELIVDHSDAALPCPCGLRGCMETIASGPAIIRRLHAMGIGNSLGELQTAVSAEDHRANAIVKEIAKAVATAIHNVAREWDATCVVLGGGTVEQIPSLMELVRESCNTRTGGISSAIHEIARAVLGDDAGVVGAALCALKAAPT